MVRLLAFPWHHGLRLDQFLAVSAPLSRRRARALIAEGGVARNGQIQRVAGRLVELADVVDLLDQAPGPELPALPSLPPISVRHQDAALLAIDKPPGMLSQPAEARGPGELAATELVLLHLTLTEGRRPPLTLVHRLDRGTSGLLLFARNQEANRALRAAWDAGRVERGYLAVVSGEPGFTATVVEAPIGRAPGGAWRFEVHPSGKPARTEIRVLERRGANTLLACRLVTGRTHQVRVHLAHLGLPVLGDVLYGAPPGSAPRPLLHAAEMRLPHPKTGQPLTLQAPAPEDLGVNGALFGVASLLQ